MSNISKLALGTVQWGLEYGITNQNGQTSALEVNKILCSANELGINMLDTAYAYGNAEEVIAKQRQKNNNFQYVTKTRPVSSKKITEHDVSLVTNGFQESMKRLQCTAVYGLLVHNADSLLASGGDRLWETLQLYKFQGQVMKIGVSVYRPEQLEKILDSFPIDLVQLPFNIYDQRFSTTGLLRNLNKAGIEVHVRSAFLQGLLLLSVDQISDYFNNIRTKHAQLHGLLESIGLKPLEACLQFCLNEETIDRVVVGCENTNQLNEIVHASEKKSKQNQIDLARFEINDEAIINPSLWLQ